MPVSAVGAQERAKVELVDDVEDEPGEVVGWQPVAQVGWEQEGLVAFLRVWLRRYADHLTGL
jgi:hypothetical protein